MATAAKTPTHHVQETWARASKATYSPLSITNVPLHLPCCGLCVTRLPVRTVHQLAQKKQPCKQFRCGNRKRAAGSERPNTPRKGNPVPNKHLVCRHTWPSRAYARYAKISPPIDMPKIPHFVTCTLPYYCNRPQHNTVSIW